MKEKDPTLREKSLETAGYAKEVRGVEPTQVAWALVSIAYSIIRYLDMDARYEKCDKAD
jgi:hypothetical protein